MPVKTHTNGDRWTVDTSELPSDQRIKLQRAMQLALVENNCASGMHGFIPGFNGFESVHTPAIVTEAIEDVLRRYESHDPRTAPPVKVELPSVSRWQQWLLKWFPDGAYRKTQINIAPTVFYRRGKHSFWVKFNFTQAELAFIRELAPVIHNSPSLKGMKAKWKRGVLHFSSRDQMQALNMWRVCCELRRFDYFGESKAVSAAAHWLEWKLYHKRDLSRA